MKKYYGIATVAAIGAGLWWWFTREAGATEPDCLDDGDCPHGYVCENGVCVPIILPDCVSDGDCPSGYICENGICVPGATADFVVNSLTCDPKSVQVGIDEVTVTVSITNPSSVGITAIVPVVVTRRDLFNMVYKTLALYKDLAGGETTDVYESFTVSEQGTYDCCVHESSGQSHQQPIGVCDWFHAP